MLISMNQNSQLNVPAKKIDLFMSRIESLLSKKNTNQDIIAMYEGNREKRACIYERVQQANKPLLLEAFDVINAQNLGNNQRDKENERDAFDVLEEQHATNFEQEYARVINIFSQTGNLKPAHELLGIYQKQNAPEYCYTTLGLFIARETALQQKSLQPLIDFKEMIYKRRQGKITQKEERLLAEIMQDVKNFIQANKLQLRPEPSAPEISPTLPAASVITPSAPELPTYEQAMREPDPAYDDILLPGNSENGNAPLQRASRQLTAYQIQEQVLAVFLNLSTEKKEEALMQLVSLDDEQTLKELKRNLPGYKKIDEALQMLATLRASAKINAQPPSYENSINEASSSNRSYQDCSAAKNTTEKEETKQQPSLIKNVGKVLLDNPVETTVATAGIVSFLWYLTRKKSD